MAYETIIEAHFDEFKEVIGNYPGEGKYTPGHYVGILWAFNKWGDRIEVEVHIDPRDYPEDLYGSDYPRQLKYCRDKLHTAYMELEHKIKQSEKAE